MKKSSIALLICLGLTTAPTMAEGFNDGLTAFIQGEHTKALRIWGPLAQKGNPDAQFHLGHMYQTGTGVKRNSDEAYRWYAQAASRGHAESSYKIKHWNTEKMKDQYVLNN